MQRSHIAIILALVLLTALLWWLGIGYYTSSSAVLDLRAELETIHGPEYTGKSTEEGTEDMVFVIKPKSFFLTNWNLRNALGMDYKYECQIIFTTHRSDDTKAVRTIIYQAYDPMGTAKMGSRAGLDLDSKEEQHSAS